MTTFLNPGSQAKRCHLLVDFSEIHEVFVVHASGRLAQLIGLQEEVVLHQHLFLQVFRLSSRRAVALSVLCLLKVVALVELDLL
jgi:hypothetical protein